MSFYLKSTIISLVCLSSAYASIAQKKQISFINGEGQVVKNKDSADFMRIIEEPDSANLYFRILEYYTDNSRKFIGQASSVSPRIVYEGATISFDKNEKKTEQVTYLLGVPFGVAYFFYPNGRVKKEIDYTPDGRLNLNNQSKLNQSILKSYFDSSGTQSVKDGNGYAILIDEDIMRREEGSYADGVKDGIWKGFYKEAGRYYEEVYKKGILISGVQSLPDGRKFDYVVIKEAPKSIKGGMDFYKYFQQNFRYPSEAQERNISGIMRMSFEIAIDGTVTNINVIPSLNYSITREVARVIKNAGKWHPAKLRGEPLQEVCLIALGFTIGPRTIIRQEVQQGRGSQPRSIRRSF